MTKLNPTGIVTVIEDNKEYDVTIIDNTVMVKQNDFYMNFVLPISDQGLLDFDVLNEDYIIRNFFEIESNMPFTDFNWTRAKNSIIPVLETAFEKSINEFTPKEKLLVIVLETIVNDVTTLNDYVYHLQVVMKFTSVENVAKLTLETLGHLVINSIQGNQYLHNVIEAVHSAKKLLLNNTRKVNTDFVFTLSPEKQKMIYIRLLQAGLSAEKAENAMNGRICDLEDIISIKDI